MQFVSSDIISLSSEADSFPEDDVDRLFKKLHKLEPPGDIVKQILARVRQLPAAQRYPLAPPSEGAESTPVTEGPQEASN